jgi:hypothetical protein
MPFFGIASSAAAWESRIEGTAGGTFVEFSSSFERLRDSARELRRSKSSRSGEKKNNKEERKRGEEHGLALGTHGQSGVRGAIFRWSTWKHLVCGRATF